MIARDDLEWLEARLSIAVYDTRRESRQMLVHDMREALKDIPGFEDLTIEYEPSGHQKLTIDGKTLEIGPMASNEEIRLALLNPFIRTENTKIDIMSVTGIQSGAFQAKLAEMREKMAAKQAAALATIDGAVTAGGAKMDEAVAGVTAKVDKEIADALHEFAQTTNGGPA